MKRDSTDLAFLAVLLRAMASDSVCHVTEEDTRRQMGRCGSKQNLAHCLRANPALS